MNDVKCLTFCAAARAWALVAFTAQRALATAPTAAGVAGTVDASVVAAFVAATARASVALVSHLGKHAHVHPAYWVLVVPLGLEPAAHTAVSTGAVVTAMVAVAGVPATKTAPMVQPLQSVFASFAGCDANFFAYRLREFRESRSTAPDPVSMHPGRMHHEH